MSTTRSETSEIASPTLPLPPPREAGEREAASRPVMPGKWFERQVPPARATLVTVQVQPHSVCYFYHPEAKQRRIQIDADNRGIVRFHARAMKGATPTEFHLESPQRWQGGATYTIALSAEIRHKPSMSSPELVSAPIVSGEVRPPLEGDPLALSDAELVAKGYPPRPDPEKAPAQYSRWLKNVSRAFTRIDTHRVAHPDYGRSKGNRAPDGVAASQSGNAVPMLGASGGSQANINFYNCWTGAYFTNPDRPDSHRSRQSGTRRWCSRFRAARHSRQWWSGIGLDNRGGRVSTRPAPAARVLQHLFLGDHHLLHVDGKRCRGAGGWCPISRYRLATRSASISGWRTSSARRSTSKVHLGRADATGQQSVWFYLTNATNGASFMGTYQTAPESQGGLTSTGFTGRTAEFILERPTINGSYTDLAFFLQPALMTNCAATAMRSTATINCSLSRSMRRARSQFDGTLNYRQHESTRTTTMRCWRFRSPYRTRTTQKTLSRQRRRVLLGQLPVARPFVMADRRPLSSTSVA